MLKYLIFLLFISCNSKVYQYHSGKTHIESSEPIQTTAILEMEQRLQMDDFEEPPCNDSIRFIGIGVTQIGNTVIVSRPKPDTVCCHDIDMVLESYPPQYHCVKCDRNISEEQFESDWILCNQSTCDHFFVKQSITIEDTALLDQDWEWMPCICIHCKEVTICK